ncbi:hypothetical protein ACFCYH_00490 [Streptomyces sp. NPDC056400]|uniref:hypothetical protein n=2 Tax=unclassified Streptomyces TaxID=2593676 RepID=UPI0035E3B27D
MPKMPKAPCPVCERLVALLPTRRAGYGSVHDHKRHPRELVLCGGSMTHVPLANATAWQEELELDVQESSRDADDTLALF